MIKYYKILFYKGSAGKYIFLLGKRITVMHGMYGMHVGKFYENYYIIISIYICICIINKKLIIVEIYFIK